MINVFIIDDAMLVRNRLKDIFKNYKEIVVLGESPNPIDAMEILKKVGFPDVFILDLEMPKMDGLTFLKQLKEQRPTPTIVFSNFVNDKSTKSIEALELGACDIVLKPKSMNTLDSFEYANDFVLKIKAAAQSKSLISTSFEKKSTNQIEKKAGKIIAIGVSTGGVQTLEIIIKNLEALHPPILIVQHMPEGFTKSFANRLNKLCVNSTIIEAEGNEVLQSGHIYIAPGNLHLEVKSIENNKYITKLKDYPKVSNHKPSVDVLFKSMAIEVGEKSVAFILTGMGKDGAFGIKKIKDSLGVTYGQDEESSIVYGMPKVAYEMGGVDKQVSLYEIINIINSMR